MTGKYDFLVPQAMAPLYRYDGRPVIERGEQVCVPFPEAAAHNWDVIRDQGTVRQYDGAGRPLSAEEIRRDIRERVTSSLLGSASSGDLFFFNPIELLVVSAEGDLLMVQRSHRGASEGMINHFAGGFPKVTKNARGFFEAEPKKRTALRETEEELGSRIFDAVDLNCMTYDSVITPFVLKTIDGGTYPGFVPELCQGFGYHWNASTKDIVSSLNTGADSVGMTIITLPALESMLCGEEKMQVRFVPNDIPCMQRFIDPSWQDGKVQLSAVRKALLASERMTDEERQQTGRFDYSRLAQAEAGPDVFYKANYASALAAFQASGMRLSTFSAKHLEKFRFESRQKMIRPRVDLTRPTLPLIPQPGH